MDFNNIYYPQNFQFINPFLNSPVTDNNHFLMNNIGFISNNNSNDFNVVKKKTNRESIINEIKNINQNINSFNYILNNDYMNSENDLGVFVPTKAVMETLLNDYQGKFDKFNDSYEKNYSKLNDQICWRLDY